MRRRPSFPIEAWDTKKSPDAVKPHLRPVFYRYRLGFGNPFRTSLPMPVWRCKYLHIMDGSDWVTSSQRRVRERASACVLLRCEPLRCFLQSLLFHQTHSQVVPCAHRSNHRRHQSWYAMFPRVFLHLQICSLHSSPKGLLLEHV